MQVTETRAEGLSREFKVTIPAGDLDKRLNEKLESIKDQVKLKGFRPGKVPVAHLKKTYGKSLMGEVVEQAVQEINQQALDERELRPAQNPKIEFDGEIEQVISGDADLEYTLAVEIMPDFEIADLNGLTVEKIVADVTEEEVDEAIGRLAEQQQNFAPRGEGEAAQDGDRLTIDFKGDIGGEPFDGGAGEDVPLVLGSGGFIEGFEEPLKGAKAGEDRDVNVTFPENYGAENLAGKDAHFAVTVKEVAAPEPVEVDDELAKRFGLESLASLKDTMKVRIKEDFSKQSRMHMKRNILDALDERHDFELPQGMVNAEFDQIWREVEKNLDEDGKSPEDGGKSGDELKDEYRKIAERRVRLGLVLAEIGRRNKIEVKNEELSRALAARARMFPGQEKQVYEFYQKNQAALAELRAPIFEDKVIDFIAELADVKERTVSKDELFSDPDGDHDHDHGHAHG